MRQYSGSFLWLHNGNLKMLCGLAADDWLIGGLDTAEGGFTRVWGFSPGEETELDDEVEGEVIGGDSEETEDDTDDTGELQKELLLLGTGVVDLFFLAGTLDTFA